MIKLLFVLRRTIIMTKEFQNYMTSELLANARIEREKEVKNLFILEYERRLKLVGLTDEQIAEFRKFDELAIANSFYTDSFIKSFIKEPIDVEKCTFSELVYITEYANSLYLQKRNSSSLSEEEERFIRQNSLYFGMCSAALEVRNRMKRISATDKQENSLLKSERKVMKKRKAW